MIKSVKICPKCKSVDIDSDLTASSAFGMASFDNFKCNKCGYSGQFFPEVDKKKIK